MTKSEMETLAQSQLEAYNRGDLEKFCDYFHAEVVVQALISSQEACRGMTAFRELYKSLFSTSPKLHCKLKNRVVLDAAVLDEEWITGSSRYTEGFHTVVTYGFRDGKIDRVWIAR